MKRQRGRGRKPGGGGNYHHNQGSGGHQHPNRQLETNGPDTKFRGTASYIHERYLQLARDAASSGDRVLSENCMQHADHYFRLVRAMQPATPAPQPQTDRANQDGEYEGSEERAAETVSAEETGARASGDEQPDVDFSGQDGAREGSDAADGESGRRRGRGRRRFRPEGERASYEAREGDEQREQGEGEREPRRVRDDDEPLQAREPRRERPPREDRETGGREGFSDGPKPAFLRGGGGE